MKRPRVICHMLTSIDGRIVINDWPAVDEGRTEYERVHESYEADGWICGRVTMEPFAEGLRDDADVATTYAGSAPRDDYRAPGSHESFAFAVDASGKLAWKVNDLSGDHVVAVLSGRVSDEYLAFLRQRGVSYIIAGEHDVDLRLALDKIGTQFGVRTLMLEGGGGINGSMLRDGLIDEVSVLVAPVADGASAATLFDVDDARPRKLSLEGVEQRPGGILWLRYLVDNTD